ncbi:MAG: hypothetical protein K8I30_01785 [Anaerolineae bacterium]|nr:hypothetical protein [Anaerolineae bacterium]
MKINFKSFRKPEEIEQFFERHITVGYSTPYDVISMLDDLGLKHSELLDMTQYTHPMPDFPFDYAVMCSPAAKPTLLLFSNKWLINFHFDKNKILAKVAVKKFGDGGF